MTIPKDIDELRSLKSIERAIAYIELDKAKRERKIQRKKTQKRETQKRWLAKRKEDKNGV